MQHGSSAAIRQYCAKDKIDVLVRGVAPKNETYEPHKCALNA
jgi:hypothetical protein